MIKASLARDVAYHGLLLCCQRLHYVPSQLPPHRILKVEKTEKAATMAEASLLAGNCSSALYERSCPIPFVSSSLPMYARPGSYALAPGPYVLAPGPHMLAPGPHMLAPYLPREHQADIALLHSRHCRHTHIPSPSAKRRSPTPTTCRSKECSWPRRPRHRPPSAPSSVIRSRRPVLATGQLYSGHKGTGKDSGDASL